MFDLPHVKDLSIAIGGIIALVTFMFGMVEYVKRGKQERAQHFLAMRRRFLETPEFRRLLHLLHTGDEAALASAPVQDKRNFLGFLEEVALLVNSGMIRRDVAHYMYGDYVLMAAENQSFWDGLDRESIYWTLFRQFVADMQAERNLQPKPRLAI